MTTRPSTQTAQSTANATKTSKPAQVLKVKSHVRAGSGWWIFGYDQD
jgi:hypothetical protein